VKGLAALRILAERTGYLRVPKNSSEGRCSEWVSSMDSSHQFPPGVAPKSNLMMKKDDPSPGLPEVNSIISQKIRRLPVKMIADLSIPGESFCQR